MNKIRSVFLVIAFAFFIGFGLVTENIYYLSIAMLFFLNAINATAFNFLLGYCGVISLGQAAFYGIGAYTTAILVNSYNLSSILIIVIAVILAMATLGFGMIVYLLMNEMESLTGGPSGVVVNNYLTVFNKSFEMEKQLYFLIFFIFALFIIAVLAFDKSRFAYRMRFVHNAEKAANAYGINPFSTKLIIFTLMAGVTSFTGALFAFVNQFVAPTAFDTAYSIELMAMSAVGGLGNVMGGVLGALIFTLLPELFASLEDYEMLIYGVTLAVTVIFLPKGLLGKLSSIIDKKLAKERKGVDA